MKIKDFLLLITPIFMTLLGVGIAQSILSSQPKLVTVFRESELIYKHS